MSIALSPPTFTALWSSSHDAASDDFVKPARWSHSPAPGSAKVDQALEGKTVMLTDSRLGHLYGSIYSLTLAPPVPSTNHIQLLKYFFPL